MHRHDKKWVTEQIMSLPTGELKHKAWEGYKKAYQDAGDKEPVEHKKENRSRNDANTRLRKFVFITNEHFTTPNKI
jgi:hypothetical protein